MRRVPRKRAGHAPATLPYSRSPLGELLAPLIACQTVPPIAPMENATPTSSMIRCGQGSRSLGSPMWYDKKAKQGNTDFARGKNGLLSGPASLKTFWRSTFQNFAPIAGSYLFATSTPDFPAPVAAAIAAATRTATAAARIPLPFPSSCAACAF